MPRVTFNRLTKKKSHARKRRISTVTRAKYRPKTTAANRRLITSNAYAIRALKRVMPPAIRTDWQLSGTLFANIQDSPNRTVSIDVVPLMNPLTWRACLRQDEQVTDSSITRVLRMSMNLRYSLGESNWCQFTAFIVTVRPQSADRVIDSNGLAIGNDYINSVGQDMNFRVSSDLFKVHYTRSVSLTKNTWVTTAAQVGGQQAGFNPQTTMARGQVNIKLDMRIRNPNRSSPWKDMEIDQFSPTQRYYLLCFFTQQSGLAPPVPATAGARLDFDTLWTCYNSG